MALPWHGPEKCTSVAFYKTEKQKKLSGGGLNPLNPNSLGSATEWSDGCQKEKQEKVCVQGTVDSPTVPVIGACMCYACALRGHSRPDEATLVATRDHSNVVCSERT